MNPDQPETNRQKKVNQQAPEVSGSRDSGRSEDWVNNQRYGPRQGWDHASSYGTDWEEEQDTLWEDSPAESADSSSEIGPQPVSSIHASLRDQAIAALAQNTTLDIANLHVYVENGALTLTGEVASAAEKQAAEEQIAGLSGVNQVHNRLLVKQRPGEPLPEGKRRQEQRQDPPV